MKFPVFSIMGLFALYLLIFRNEDLNKHMSANAWSITNPTSDTLPEKPKYVDIYTGEPIEIWYDTGKHMTMNQATRMPVEFYINTSNWDTVYGRGQFVVNNFIIRDVDGRYKLDENKVKIDGDEIKIKDGDRKLKIDGEEFKLKDGDLKIKHDMEDGEGKIKSDSTKIKIEDDELKIKSGDDKLKAEKDEAKIKSGDDKIKVEKDETKIKKSGKKVKNKDGKIKE